MAGKANSFNKGQIVARGQGHTTCLHHKGNILDWFCETCHDVICVNCISTSHKGHRIVPLSESTPKNKHKIKTFINKTEQNELITLQQDINSTQESLAKHLSHFKGVAEGVKQQGKKLKEDIDVFIAQTLLELQQLEDENTELLTSYKTELVQKLAELKDQLNQCKETVQTGTDIKVFDVTSRLHTDNTLPRRPILGTAKFSQNKSPSEALTSAFGKMTLTSCGQTDDHVTAKVGASAGSSDQQLTRPLDQTPYIMAHSTTIPTPLPIISVLSVLTTPCDIIHICPASDSGAWLSEANKTLTHLTSEGRVKQQVKSLVRVTNICRSPFTLKVWTCSEEDNSVMELTSGTLVRLFNTEDKPMCLCVTKDGDVLVGTKEEITKYTQRGKPISKSKKPLVCSPRMISECPVSEKVAVLDGDLSLSGGPRIIVMNKHLAELYKYETNQQTSRTESLPFDPWDVTYDRSGQLVVTDFYNSCLHLLSGDAQYLGRLYTEIDKPQAVCVDMQGVLWVAFGSMFGADKVKRLKYTSD